MKLSLLFIAFVCTFPTAHAEPDDLFGRVSRAYRKIDPDTLMGDCVYDLARTFVTEIKIEKSWCNKPVAIRVCNARIVCRTGAKRELKTADPSLSLGSTCLAEIDGKCPSDPSRCVDGAGLSVAERGEDAIQGAKLFRGRSTNWKAEEPDVAK